jgi:hypothetical protein
MTKKPIDIEKLLQWVMRDELPKGRPVTADPEYLIGRPRPGTFRAPRAHTGVHDDSLGFVPGMPCDDASRVAEALRGLDNRARLADVDDARCLFGETIRPIAAEAIASLMTASFEMRTITLKHAVMGTRPAWQSDHPVPTQLKVASRDARGWLRERPLVHGIDEDGIVVMLLPGRTKRERQVYDLDKSPRSPINWCSPSPLDIGHMRAEYLTWYIALEHLSRELAGRLDGFEVLPPAVARRPWETGQTPDPKVLSDGRTMRGRLALVPQRYAVGRPFESRIETQARLAKRQHTADMRRRKIDRSIELARNARGTGPT